MNQEHHNKEILNNNKGINQDVNDEMKSGQPNGKYFDAQNMRLSDHEGDEAVAKKIKGEEIAFDKNYNNGFYVCIGSISVKDRLVEFWVEENGADDPIIRIDGNIVAKSDGLPWIVDKPLQLDKNETCGEGEVFVTDFNTPPLIFDIQDLLDNVSTQKYFDDFNSDLYSVNLSAPVDIPVFRELVNVGGGGGLPVGSYQYSLRFSNEAGDKTNWGPLTPPIPVVSNLSTASNQYPGVRTFGGDPDNTIQTSYGIKLRFRVNNVSGYDYVEIRRLSYDSETGVDFVPGGELVARIDIDIDEISVREWIDPSDSNVQETLSEDDELNVMNYIEKAKAIRYHDKRLVLMNIENPDMTAEPDFEELNGKKIFPIVKALGKQGHNDPYNHTYYKNYMSGEKHSFGVNFYDGTGGRGFTVTDPALDNVQTPNRRTPADADSVAHSYEGIAKAADTTCTNVGEVFEIFDHEDAIGKNDVCSFVNILNDKGLDGFKAGISLGRALEYCNVNPGFGSQIATEEIGLKPFTPTSSSDSDVTGHGIRVNVRARKDFANYEDYNPQAFGIDYYSRGFALPGLTNIPSWAKSFSVVKTKRADRVICQGIGMYSLNDGDLAILGGKNATKELDKMWFHSIDIEKGLVNQAILDDINSNPGNYKVQLISPLGFFSELYNFEETDASYIGAVGALSDRDRIIDMISYARILHDEGQINAGESNDIGIDDGSGNRYVSFNKYRNSGDSAGGGVFGGNGDVELDIDAINIVTTEERSTYYELDFSSNVYQHGNVTSLSQADFNDNGCKQFTEPFYIVNIIQTGREVIDQNINNYRSTGHYQKIESIIGQGDSTVNQSFVLVDERWQDCIPSLDPSNQFAQDESFVYLRDSNLVDRAYMCSTFLSPTQIVFINAQITANGSYTTPGGTVIYGLYSHTNVNNKDFTIVFDQGYNPAAGELVVVKYDTRLPIQFFGGDTTISENIFAPIDREADADLGDRASQFTLNIGFPHRSYELNPRYLQVNRTTGANKIMNSTKGRLTYIRQMCIMYASENRVGANYAYGLTYPFQHFPQTNYVVRPHRFKDDKFNTEDPTQIADDNNMSDEYFNKYPEEWLNWKYGGFRFEQKTNIDYAVKGPIEFFSKPQIGFKDQNKFCTRVVWSLPRQINVQDSPSLKTFPSTNVFDIEDKNGAIVYAWDAMAGSTGENLYAITESGICLLLTKKSILSNLTGEDLTVTAVDSFINKEYWITDYIGAPQELWRTIADSDVSIITESGSIIKPALYFTNKESVYRLLENQVVDIARNSYRKTMTPILENLRSGYFNKISSVFNRRNNEYWVQIDDNVFVYDQNEQAFAGRFTYDFDKYTFHKNRVYGHRGLFTFELDKGFTILNQPIEAYLINNTSMPAQPIEKEFISININTGKRGTMKPTEVQFLDEETLDVLCSLNQANQGPLYLKQYDGWFQFIPRKDLLVSPTRDRLQGRILFYKIIHTFEEEFKITNTVIQSKNIK